MWIIYIAIVILTAFIGALYTLYITENPIGAMMMGFGIVITGASAVMYMMS